MSRAPWLALAAGAAMLVQVPLALLVAPPAAGFVAPMTQRILYYHVPAAWAAYLAFAMTAGASAWVLARRDARADRLAHASAEVGTVFSLIALLTGLAWARVEFIGYSPAQDPKVVTLVALVLSYVAYLALRAGVEEPARRARVSAVFGLLAFLGVPLSYLASRASVHPDWSRPDQGVDASIGLVLLASTLAFTLLLAALVQVRMRLGALEQALEDREEP